ncbi:hypothetical protein EVAR_102831_1 [Eumeta japonica]|uniref:Uncharacterized protein n=1 Tax=Eumeta variegata TaxID=151549 RepID=A0A4C1UMN0_EUMVA|nr:hypothetical protein EVAR_102831_1 [Eumeta japonica]
MLKSIRALVIHLNSNLPRNALLRRADSRTQPPAPLTPFVDALSIDVAHASSQSSARISSRSTLFDRYLGKLRESKKTDLFYHLICNVSLPFLKHAGAQHSELSGRRTIAARREKVQRSRRATDGRRCPALRIAPGVTA